MQGVWAIPDQVVCATTFPDKEVKHDTTGWAPYIVNTGDLLGKLRFSENLTIAQGSYLELAHKNKEPFIGVCGALHLEDIWPLFTGSDPLGLRGRLCLFYTRPVMKRARDIAAANTRIGNAKGSNQLEKLLVDRYFPIYQAHAQEHRDEGHFTFHLEYPFLNYDFAARPR